MRGLARSARIVPVYLERLQMPNTAAMCPGRSGVTPKGLHVQYRRAARVLVGAGVEDAKASGLQIGSEDTLAILGIGMAMRHGMLCVMRPLHVESCL